MKKSLKFTLPPQTGLNNESLKAYAGGYIGLKDETPFAIRINRRSIDARNRQVKINVELDIYWDETPPPLLTFQKEYKNVKNSPPVVIVGAGPAGLFGALRAIELGMKPIVVERGKDVRERRRDLAAINKNNIVNPDSNYCFGEGGAGTYSDGKLYTRSNKRGNIKRILEIFVAHGANPDILIDTHPHIGTNKLPVIISEMRQSILDAGGEIHFNTRVNKLLIKDSTVFGVETHLGDKIEGIAVMLCTGHSARDIFEMLLNQNVYIENKPFALGVRVEHPQALIDEIQYHGCDRTLLPAASYSLVSQVNYCDCQRGVFSFCMCPGGFIVPSATADGEVVVNGMSPSRRDSKYANSGIVTAIEPEDLQAFQSYGPLAGMYFQKAVEQAACKIAGGTQAAPAQRLFDFTTKKISKSLPDCSYQPGIVPVDLSEIFPEAVAYRLREGFKDFGKKMKGYLTNEAVVVGTESRTSSPVRIPRNKETFEHVQIKNLFPCGEGAGYAGGIVSSAMDGEKCIEMINVLSR